MKTPAAAMLWQIWRAQRWGMIGCLAYLLTAVIVAQFLPRLLAQTSFGAEALPQAGWQIAMPCLVILVYFLAVFSVTGSADFQEKGYAPFMLTLPVKTTTLAMWPMIYGSVALGGLWTIVSLGILRATGIAAPLFWPIAALAVMLTLLQTISWMPFAQSWLRFIVALPLLVLPVVGVVLCAQMAISPWIAASGFLLLLPFSTWGCMHGVAMARRGDAVDWKAATRLADRFAAWRKPAERPFSSINAAQFWYEFRVYGRMLPFFVALVLPMFGLMVFVLPREEIAQVGRLIALMLLMPTLFAATLGGQTGNVAFPFLATRPIDGARLIGAKVKVALVSAILSSSLALIVAVLFVMRPAMWESMTMTLRAIGPFQSSLIIVLVVVGPPLLTWKFLIENLFLGLSGRAWFTNTCVLGGAALIGVGTLVGLWVSLRPDLQEVLKTLSPWLIYGLALAKIGMTIWLLRRVILRKLISLRMLRVLVFVWAAICMGLSGLLIWQLRGLPLGVALIVAGVIVMLPINRLVVAPLMLDWNRHR